MAEQQTTTAKVGGFTIFPKILLTMLLVSLIPLGGLFYISVYKAKENASGTVTDKLRSSANALNGQIKDWLQTNRLMLEQNRRTEVIQSMDSARQHEQLKTIVDNYPWIRIAYTTDPVGHNIARSDDRDMIDYSDRGYIKQIIGGKPIGTEVVMARTSGNPANVFAMAIDSKDGKRLGILCIGMDLADLSNTIGNLRIGSTGYATLLDDKGRLVSSGNEALTAELQDLSDHPALATMGSQEPVTYVEEGREIVGYSVESDYGWKLIVQQDHKEAFEVATQTQQHALILVGITLVVVILVATLLAAGLSRPIRNLTAIADNISRGELGTKIAETSRRDEIGALARAIERMGVSLEMAFQRLRKK